MPRGTGLTKELRLDLPIDLHQAFDMIAMGKNGLPMTRLGVQVIRAYVVEKHRQATLLAKLPAIHPEPADSEWSQDV